MNSVVFPAGPSWKFFACKKTGTGETVARSRRSAARRTRGWSHSGPSASGKGRCHLQPDQVSFQNTYSVLRSSTSDFYRFRAHLSLVVLVSIFHRPGIWNIAQRTLYIDTEFRGSDLFSLIGICTSVLLSIRRAALKLPWPPSDLTKPVRYQTFEIYSVDAHKTIEASQGHLSRSNHRDWLQSRQVKCEFRSLKVGTR